MITRSFEIDQEAQTYLKESLPSSWLFREQKPDIYIDYYIEIVDRGHLTGLNFAVQLKGRNQINIQHEYIKIQFKTSQLLYYLNQVRVPVYLIICDVKSKSCYWLFLQEYIQVNINTSLLHKNKHVTIKVPVRNTLTDINYFTEYVVKSEKYIRDLFPSSIPASINAQKEHWKRLDPRIDIEIAHRGNTTSFKLRPKEKIDFSFHIKKEKSLEFRTKIEEALDKGTSATIDIGDLEVKGSDLISELMDTENVEGKFTLHPVLSRKGSVIFETVNETGKTSSILYNINGKLFFGRKEFTFEGEIENAPFKINISCPIEPINNTIVANFGLEFKIEKWVKKPIIFLPYRERLYNLFNDLVRGLTLVIQIDFEGNNIYKTSKVSEPDKNIKYIFRFFELVHRAAIISQLTKVNLMLPEEGSITEEDWEMVDVLFNILQYGEYRRDSEKTKFSISIPQNADTISKIKNYEKSDGPMSLITNKIFKLFGQHIDFGNLRYEISNIKFITDFDSITPDEINNDKSIVLEWIGEKGSELIITKAVE